MGAWVVRRAGLVLGAALAVLALGPLLVRRGYTLTVDMVFVPDPPWWDGLLGLDGRVPRAVPSDALVALLALPLPADVVQKLLLGLTPVLAATGTLRLVRLLLPTVGLPAGLAAAALVAWNPYVAERLALGQWAVLLGLAALPWVVVGAVQVRAGARGGWPVLALALGVAALTPSGGVVAAVTALAVVASPGAGSAAPARRVRLGGPLLLAAVVNAPWWVPSVLRPGGVPADPAGFSAFAARADSPLGLLGSLLTLGGVWDPGAVPAGRDSVAGLVGPLLVLALVAAGAVLAVRRRTVPVGLTVVAASGVLLALAGAAGALDRLGGSPAPAVLRDGSRLLGPLVLLEALLLAIGVGALLARVARPARAAVAVLAVLLPVLALPGLALGLGGRLGTVAYPQDWTVVRALLAEAPDDGAVLSLPWSAYRQPGWNEGRTVLDPAVKAFGRRVVADDRLVVGGRTLAGEDPAAARLAPALDAGVLPDPAELRRVGVGWVLVARSATAGPGGYGPGLAGLDLAHDGAVLGLYRVPGEPAAAPPTPPVVPVVLADLAAGATLLVAAGALVVAGTPGRRRGNRTWFERAMSPGPGPT